MTSTVAYGANPRRFPSARYVGGSRYAQASLYATVLTFYAAGVYHRGLAEVLTLAKWIPLAALLLTSLQVAARRGLLKNLSVGPIFVIVVPLFVSTMVSENSIRSLGYAFAFLVVLLTASLVAVVSNHDDGMQSLFNVYAKCSRVFIALSALTYILDIDLGRGGGRFSGWTDNPNTLAMLLAPSIVVLIARCIEGRPRWLWMDATCVLAGTLVLLATGSRASFLWVMGSTGILLFGRKLNPVTLALTFFSIVVVIAFKQEIELSISELLNREASLVSADVLSGRTEIWELAFSLHQARPYFGYGLGMEEELILANKWRIMIFQGGHFHNSYISLLIETGYFGLIVVGGVILALMVRGFNNLQKRRNVPLAESVRYALPWAIAIGALIHAGFETWIFSPGGIQILLFWACIWSFEAPVRRTKGHAAAQRIK